jgi:hypothetical protein
MKPSASRLAGRASALLLCGVLCACVVAPAAPPYYPGPMVTVAPPPPLPEVIGVAPGPGYFWIGGYWNWAGGRYAWAPGRWEHDRPGYAWVPHQWHHEGEGWRSRPGHWERR